MKIFLTGAILILLTAGCSRDYFTDGGSLSLEKTATLGVSTTDYLRTQGTLFDTLVTLIEMSGLEAAVNAKGNTFLAPSDYSIYNYLNLVFPDPQKRPASLRAIPQEEMNKITGILKNYIIPNQEVVRDKLATTYSYFTTYGEKKARFNLVQDDYLGNVKMGAKFIVFSLNTAAPGQKERYQSVQVATSDLHSTNGVVHLLISSSHIFGFN